MRSYSFFTILMLCVAIIVLDILAFYWLQSITQFISSSVLKIAIHTLFWLFTFGLVTAIILLKIRLDSMDPRRKHILISSLYGLTVSSFVPKLLFVIIISILYFLNYMFSETQSLIIVPLVGLLSGFIPFFFIVYGIFKSAYRFKVYHRKVRFKNLPKTFNGLKVVQLSDIHLGSFNYRYHVLAPVVEKINSLAPDYIFITGDLVNNYAWELRGWHNVFKQLKANYGKYAILGNHDYGDYSEWMTDDEKQDNFNQIKQFFKHIDFKLLLNSSEVLTHDNDNITLIGVENWGKPPFKQYGDLQEALKTVEDSSFKILLSHDPTHWSEEVLNQTNIDLTFSGHTHGMQAGFERKSFQWSPIQYNYKYWAGLYNEGEQYLYVNRGIGWLGFPGRLGMRPEITFLELICA
ncbi:metallophosphoesterase [uncultured Psychroserpens sp.]|uniref:metallophosphoesterase n=1 Tax=uncultured Psychroserpens sp. TaxID=255436 RepID=UPI00263310A5|nr:metallophosphoesterase [uncultured Psychroserpens sp.]